MSIDRLNTGYEPDFDIDRAVGEQGEFFALGLLEAAKSGLGEIKYDQRASQTGNVFTEFWCLKRKIPSGIEATKADYWGVVLGAPPAILIASLTPVWREAHEEALREGLTRMGGGRGDYPTQGTVMPIAGLVSRLLAAQKAIA